MNCNPTPETTCGTLTSDACVTISGTWPACFPQTGDCYRQSEWNSAAGTLLCNILTDIETITDAIDVSELEGCPDGPIPIVPTNTTVAAELQNVYDLLCEWLAIGLDTPLVLGSAPGLDLSCLVPPCGVPITTLGGLLQALINCCCSPVEEQLVYKATLTQTSTDAPIAVELVNTFTSFTFSWTYLAMGVYRLVSTGTPFPDPTKVEVTTGSVSLDKKIYAFVEANNIIEVRTGDGVVLENAVLNNLFIQIKVYP